MFLLCTQTNRENNAFCIFFENFLLDFDLNQKQFLFLHLRTMLKLKRKPLLYRKSYEMSGKNCS